MANRRRIILGSLAGAAAIHLGMLACSSNAPGPMGLADGGGLDAAGVDVAVVDTGSAADTGHIVATGEMRCRAHNNDSNDTSRDNTVQAVATLTTLNATQVEVRFASLAFPNNGVSGRFIGPTFTDLVFRATDPNGHYLGPFPSAYVP